MRNIALIMFMLIAGCTVSQSTAEQVLGDEGYTDIELTGWVPFACGGDDDFVSGFRARRTVIGPDGVPHTRFVEGVLCCGWLKDCTVRH